MKCVGVVAVWLVAGGVAAQEQHDAARGAAAAACAKWEGSDLSDRALLEAAVAAVLAAGAPAITDLGARVRSAAAAEPKDRRRIQALDAAVTHVAIGFLKRESESDTVFEGQYAPLRPLMPFVGKLYLDLLIDTPDWYDGGNRHVLVAPLRDLFPTAPGAEVMASLREIANDEDLEPEPLRTNLAFALAQWGDRKLIDARIARIDKELAAAEAGDVERRTALRYELADIHYTLRDYAPAARIHVELLREGEAGDVVLVPNHYYNAACALARAGQLDAALDELERAVAKQTSGRVDPSQMIKREVFERDHDLDPLRGHARFEAAFAKAFPKKPAVKKDGG